MHRVRRYLQSPPGHVWALMVDARRWYIRPEGFRPVVGSRFVITAFPVVGTRFTGKFVCEVLAIEPQRRLEFAYWASARAGVAPRWTATWILSEFVGGTFVTCILDGDEPRDRDERMLLRISAKLVEQTMHHLHAQLTHG